MFHYINQPHTPSFLIGLVKTESNFTVRSVETGLRRWTPVVPAISVRAYPFLAFSYLTCYLEDTGIIRSKNSTKTELRSSNQESSPSSGKNTRIVLMTCLPWKCVPTGISDGMDFSKVPGCQLLWQMSGQWRSQKILPGFIVDRGALTPLFYEDLPILLTLPPFSNFVQPPPPSLSLATPIPTALSLAEWVIMPHFMCYFS